MTEWSGCRTSARVPVRPHHRYTNAKLHNLISGSLFSEFFWRGNEWPAALCEAKKVEQKFLAIVFIYSGIALYDPYCLNLSTNLEYKERERQKMLTANAPRNGSRAQQPKSRDARAIFFSDVSLEGLAEGTNRYLGEMIPQDVLYRLCHSNQC